MAAFSSFKHLDSSSSSSLFSLPKPNSSPSTTINDMCALFHDPNNALSQLYQHNPPLLHHASINANNSNKNDNHHSISSSSPPLLNAANKNSNMDSSLSVVTDKNLLPLSKKRKSKPASSSSPNSAQSKDMREVKGKKEKKVKECKEKKEAPLGYIHVRARRGQATDSHSLAERVRRERISERMKLLQGLVPGCDKVTGKALMLDEIINYVQSLQNQVEFLSMKLASVNPTFYDFGMDLESFMVGPDQNLNSLPSPLPECSPTTANTYPALDNSVNSLPLHHSLIPNAPLPQGDRQVLWDVDEQRQKTIINQSGFNSFFSFPLMQ